MQQKVYICIIPYMVIGDINQIICYQHYKFAPTDHCMFNYDRFILNSCQRQKHFATSKLTTTTTQIKIIQM